MMSLKKQADGAAGPAGKSPEEVPGGPDPRSADDRMGEGVAIFRSAISVSRRMRGNAEEGKFNEVALQMKGRDQLLARACRLLGGLRPSPSAEGPALRDWNRLLAVLEEFCRENGLLIRTLKEKKGKVLRNIVEAEARRRISRYLV